MEAEIDPEEYDSLRIRNGFFITVYGLALLFYAMTWGQALPLFLIEEVRQFLKDNFFIIFIGIAAFYIFVNVYQCLIIFKKSTTWEIITIILSIESQVLILAVWCTTQARETVGITFGISMAICVVIVFLAFVLPVDVTGCVILMFACKMIATFGCITLILIFVFTKDNVVLIVFFSLMVAYTVLVELLFYKTQMISGKRAVVVPNEEWFFGAFMTYVILAIMFLSLLPLLGEINLLRLIEEKKR